MSCTQTSICLPNGGLFLRGHDAKLARTYLSLSQSSYLHVSSVYTSATHQFQHCKAFSRLIYSASKYKRCTPVYAYGGKGNSKSENEAFSWNSLKKAMRGLRQEQSVEDILRKQMIERKFNGGGGGRNPPSGGGGDGSGGPKDEKFAEFFDELLQVIMATIGFIFVYICLVRGEELTRLARDYIRYLFGAKSSPRLIRAMDKWRRFYETITWKEAREYWLERASAATPTWWHKPRQLVQWMRSCDES